MRFGLYAPIPMAAVGSPEMARSVAQAKGPLPAGARDAQFDHGLALLLAADAVGFDLALFAERHLGEDMAAWVNASAIASRLERVRALVAVHPGLLDPVMVAKLAASLDRVCAGRVAINIVNGWFDQEFEMFGGAVLQGEARYKRTEEFIAILRGLWREETFSFEGEHYTLREGRLLLKPAAPTPPEIFSVSRSDRGRDFIARTCDWWFVDFPKEPELGADDVLRALEAAILDMRGRAARFGRAVRFALNPFLAIGDGPEDALAATVRSIFAFDPDPDARKIERRMIPATKAGCMGTPAEIRRQVARLEAMGFDLLLLKLIPTVDNVRRIGAEIIAR